MPYEFARIELDSNYNNDKNTMNMMNDSQIQPNFVPRHPPNHPQDNYIEDHDEDVMN